MTRLGLSFRPELALFIERAPDLGFVEVMAEDYHSPSCVPSALKKLQKRGVELILHCTSLNLGGAAPVDAAMVKHLDALARYLDAPFVGDHVALVRAAGIESGHLLPVKRNTLMLDVIERNVAAVQSELSVPLVLENIATTFDYSANLHEFDEAEFLTRLLERTGCRFLLDISNLYANGYNHGFDAAAVLDRLPLERLEYVHMAGGTFKHGLYHDTHCDPLTEGPLRLLESLAARVAVPRVMLERDDKFAPPKELRAELDAVYDAATRPVSQSSKPQAPESPATPAVLEIGTSGSSSHVSAAVAPLAREQEALLRALVFEEFTGVQEIDSAALALAARALKRKRNRTIKRACPEIANQFVDEASYDAALLQYFAESPPHASGPYEDGMDFLRYLEKQKSVNRAR